MIGLEDLFNRGGPILYLLFIVAICIWYIIFSKYLDTNFYKSNWLEDELNKAKKNIIITKTNYDLFEDAFLATVRRISLKNVRMLDGLLAMCPMLGLLGTVYGMIEVFEVLAVLGTGNPRAMSTGVAKATIPTMAGMTIALTGLYFKFDLQNRVAVFEEKAKTLLKNRISI